MAHHYGSPPEKEPAQQPSYPGPTYENPNEDQGYQPPEVEPAADPDGDELAPDDLAALDDELGDPGAPGEYGDQASAR